MERRSPLEAVASWTTARRSRHAILSNPREDQGLTGTLRGKRKITHARFEFWEVIVSRRDGTL
jgi:hypothetical protein